VQLELQNDKKKKKEKEEQEEEAEQRNEVGTNETVEAYKAEQEKYKELKNQMPKKGNGALLQKVAILQRTLCYCV
jgi:hypothetical protein